MILARRLDRECIALQRQGELTVYPAVRGPGGRAGRQRVRAGSPTTSCSRRSGSWRRRSCGGVDPVEYLAVPPRDVARRPVRPTRHRFAPICVPVATQIVHAVGYAMGLRLDGTRGVSIAYFGDGCASEGDFHEGGNLAGVFRAPGDLVLPEQRVGDQRARPPTQTRGQIWRAPRATASPACASTATTCSPSTGSRGRPSAARAPASGPTLIEAVTYRDRRALDGRRRRALPRRGRGRGRAGTRPDRSATARGSSARGSPTKPFVAECEDEAEAQGRRIRAGVIAQPGAAGRVDVRLDVTRIRRRRCARQRAEVLGDA